ncbi:DUF72 domain-containing protein [Aquincola sp. S2]|uniref:DUF72 domain-containing protein n=1 Tax=Pseudaquabacterium terrae TaxID=2732868 RepID=A0ABX2EAR1_9BURK|nr:DUF72 domain-containing protein [Aquabacterium terrae]NRF66189.1 DUF72 domain-containing protein [Aquabacterium terrae]
MASPQAELFAPETPPGLGPRGNIFVGTCSWTDVSLIKSGGFYPRGCSSAEARLRYYASCFPVVEVDSSYFAMPVPENAALWVERTPAAFQFNIKAFRVLTGHQTPPSAFPPDLQPLLPPLKARQKNHYYDDLSAELRDELWRRFAEAIAPLRHSAKLRAVHFQFAPWVAASADWIAHVEQCVQRLAGHRLAVEFRNQTWFAPERAERTLAWQRELGVAHVVVDEPQGVGNYAQGVWAVTDPALAVVRLHGRNEATWNAKGLTASSERFNYEYRDEELRDIAERSARLAEEVFALQVLVNVNYEDQGVRAARQLQALLQTLPSA